LKRDQDGDNLFHLFLLILEKMLGTRKSGIDQRGKGSSVKFLDTWVMDISELMRLLLKSDTAIQRYSDTGTGTWNRNLEPCIIYAN
jgi:hypothetical protein